MIHGILIEGTEDSGKTTVSHLVARTLAEHGVASQVGHGYVHGNRLLDRFLHAARTTSDLLEIDWYYSANMLLDLALCRRALPREFVVQDRHWLSQVGRNEFFHAAAPLPTELIEAQHLPFAYNVYLKSDAATKRERASLRPPSSLRDAYLRKHADVHQRYDEYLERRLPRGERWSVIDTSGRTAEDVAALIAAPLLHDLVLQAVRSGDSLGSAPPLPIAPTPTALRESWPTI
jgi:thymidylate kinase